MRLLLISLLFLLSCSNHPDTEILEAKSDSIDYYQCCTIYHFNIVNVDYHDSLDIDLAIRWLNYKYSNKQHIIEYHQYK